jgi:hypothetical protein
LLITAGSTEGADSWKKDAIKQIYLFLASFFHEQMLCICPQCIQICSGGALVPLRSGSSANAQKAGKTTADISDSARAADCKLRK